MVSSLMGGNYISSAPSGFPAPTIFNDQIKGIGSGRIGTGVGWLFLYPVATTEGLTVGICGNQGIPGQQNTATVTALILYGTWK